MTSHSLQQGLLVVSDGADGRADWYRTLVSEMFDARRIEVATPDELSRSPGVRDRGTVAVVDLADEESGDSALVRVMESLRDSPVVVISSRPAEIARALLSLRTTPTDVLDRSTVAPELLRAKLALLLEFSRLNADLAAARSDVERCRQDADAARQLVNEQIHRGKNLLAIVQSITMRTLKDRRDMADARSTLLGRLKALARVNELATHARSKGVDLGEIVEAELGEAFGRVAASGPAVRLTGSFAQTFGLAIHELVSNATKYGSLTSADGGVTLNWEFADVPERHLAFDWTEHGVPIQVENPVFGFGLALVSSLARFGSDGPRLSFGAEGFACRLRLPQAVMVSAAS